MMHQMACSKAAMFLISLGVGYLVCVKADAQKGLLKKLGYLLGAIIIAASLLIPACILHCHMKNGKCMTSTCGPSPMGAAGKVCPMSQK